MFFIDLLKLKDLNVNNYKQTIEKNMTQGQDYLIWLLLCVSRKLIKELLFSSTYDKFNFHERLNKYLQCFFCLTNFSFL